MSGSSLPLFIKLTGVRCFISVLLGILGAMTHIIPLQR